MKRRNFLKSCLAGVAVAAVPSIAIGAVKAFLPESRTGITVSDIENAVSMLNENGCRPMSDGNYIAWCHPDVHDDILALGPIEGIRASADHNYLNMRGRW